MSDTRKTTKPNVPNLRFPGFEGEWENKRIGDIGKFFSGGTPSSSRKDFYGGEIPFIRSGEIHSDKTELFLTQEGYKNSSAKMVEVGDILLALYGANSGDISISQMRGAINQAILCIRTNVAPVFFKSVWEKHAQKILNTYLQGGQGNLSADIVKKITISIPSQIEQAKIAALFSHLDERISIQNRLIEDLKKLRCAIVEKMFKQSKANGRLGDFIEQVSVRNKNGLYSNVLSVSNKQGFVKQSEQFEDRTVASEDTSNYKIVKRNNFAYNPARINVGSIARLTKFDVGIVSPMYVCFRTKASIIPEYMEAFFTSQQFFYEMMKRLEGSVRLCLSYEGLCNIPVYIPDMNKQIAMGQNISLILSKIGLEIEYLGRLHQQKQYLLRKMFI